MKHSTQDLAEMANAVGGTQIAARQWLEAGFSPGDAAAYVHAGCFDVDRTAKLKQAQIAPHQIATSGLAWDYCCGTVPLDKLKSMLPTSEMQECLHLQ